MVLRRLRAGDATVRTVRHPVQNPKVYEGRWFESTAAHHCFRNANRRSGKPEGWDDAIPALNPHLDHQLFEQSFPLAWCSLEHGVTESFFQVAYDLDGRRNEHFRAVGFPQVLQSCAKL